MATEWFYFKKNEKHGPVGSKELLRLASTGFLLKSDLVWKVNWKDAKPAGIIKGLFPENDGDSQRNFESKAQVTGASSTEFSLVDKPNSETIRIPPMIKGMGANSNQTAKTPIALSEKNKIRNKENRSTSFSNEMLKRKEQAKSAFSLYKLFWTRILRGDFSFIHSTPPEILLLTSASAPVSSALAQDYACWRRSLLMVCALVLGVSLVFAGYDAVTGAMDSIRHPVIRLQGFSLFIFQFISFVLCILAAKNWFSIRLSRSYARMAWIVQFAGPFLVFFAPLSLFVSDQLILFSLGLTSIVTLAPKIFGLFPGLIRCSLTIKTLLPEAAAPGWLGIVISPLFFLMLFVAAIAALQTAFIILGIGFICLGIGSLGILIYAKNLLIPSSQDSASEVVAKVKRFQGTFQAVGIGLVLWQVLKVSGITKDLVSDLLLFAFSYLGNVTLLTVAMSDFMLGMIREGQKQAEVFFNSEKASLYQERLDQLAACGFTDFDAGESLLADKLISTSSSFKNRVVGRNLGADAEILNSESNGEISDFI